MIVWDYVLHQPFFWSIRWVQVIPSTVLYCYRYLMGFLGAFPVKLLPSKLNKLQNQPFKTFSLSHMALMKNHENREVRRFNPPKRRRKGTNVDPTFWGPFSKGTLIGCPTQPLIFSGANWLWVFRGRVVIKITLSWSDQCFQDVGSDNTSLMGSDMWCWAIYLYPRNLIFSAIFGAGFPC